MSKSKLRLETQSNILEGFNWGGTGGWFRKEIHGEFTNYKDGQYQVDLKVEEGDIVFDFGASMGPFIWQIKDQKPSKVICVEPSNTMISTLVDNCQTTGLNCEIFKVGVGSISGEETLLGFNDDGSEVRKTFPTLTFMDIVKNSKVDKIDFLKTDCEGGEYNIFNNENIWWIKDNVRKIVGEFHLGGPGEKEKFIVFRDTYLRLFPKVKLYSIDMFEISKNYCFTQDFLNYYNQVIVYIDNR